jgi:Mrp family chromosome partitioning ATPase
MGDGKTTIAWNLAVTGATDGERGAPHRSRLATALAKRKAAEICGPGLSAVLASVADAAEVVPRIGSPRRWPTSAPPSTCIPLDGFRRSDGLLQSARMEHLGEDAEDRYDLVVIGAPPALVSESISFFGTPPES